MADDSIRIELDEAPPAWLPTQPGSQAHAPTDMHGLRFLPGEQLLRTSRRTILTPLPELRDGLYLTNLRVVYAGRLKQWGIFPRGKVVRSAFIDDIDVGVIGMHRLSAWWLILGILLGIAGIAALSGASDEGIADNLGALWLLVGIFAVGMWFFVRREGIWFAVAGDEAFSHRYFQVSSQERSAMIDFLNAFFELKHGLTPAEGRPSSGLGFEA